MLRMLYEESSIFSLPQTDTSISSGGRLSYFGRSYFTEVRHTPDLQAPRLAFTGSRFVVECPWGRAITLDALVPTLRRFYSESAEQHLLPRVRVWGPAATLPMSCSFIRG